MAEGGDGGYSGGSSDLKPNYKKRKGKEMKRAL